MARSRYSSSGIIGNRYHETFSLEQTNRFKQPDTFDDVKFRSYTVKHGDRLDHLAARFLNEDKYYWIIALVNDLVFPIISPGQKIKIPFNVQDILDRM